MSAKFDEISENEVPNKLIENEIFKDGLEGVAYIYMPETGQEIVQVSDDISNISLRGLKVISAWLIQQLLSDGFTKEECYKVIHEIGFYFLTYIKNSNSSIIKSSY